MRVLKWLGAGLVVLVVLAFVVFSYLRSEAHARYQKRYDIPVVDLPVPFPLSEAELEELRGEQRAKLAAAAKPTTEAEAEAEIEAATDDEAAAALPDLPADLLAGLDLDALALERALARGKRYIESRAGCTECHGEDLGGKILIDNPVLGTWVAPNITRGGLTKSYGGRDWLRILRHGVKPDGTASSMPSVDFTWFSDQEISDLATYIVHQPPVDRVMPKTSFGPVFAMLITQGEIPISAEVIDHLKPRPAYPPAIAPTAELGKHLSTTCTGCHGQSLTGGPIKGGDPDWPPAKNLTFHETGLAGWSLADFTKAMREGVRPDGAKVDLPMPIAYTSKLQDAELEALYVYLKELPRAPLGSH